LTFNMGEAPPSGAVESEPLSIGELARVSGLSASALRFYDRSGVLRPAYVDPDTGYRWYLAGQVRPARVVAALRRVAMPLAEIGRVLSGPPAEATALIDGHLRRLETGLADAQRELSHVRILIEPEESTVTGNVTGNVTTCTVAAADLAGALRAVRFATGTDPELPMLAGVLIELAPAERLVRFVATDRYRLAVAAAPAVRAVGTAVRAVAPVSLVDDVSALLGVGAPAEVTVDGDRVTVRAGEREVSAAALPYDFPDYRRLLPGNASRTVAVNASRLHDELATLGGGGAGAGTVAVLSVGSDGSVGVETGAPVAGAARIGVNPQFLSQALAAAGNRRIMLELRAPAEPMILRPADGAADTYSLLMPVRLG
jgi:DNA-binding transcriptional MerR regulator